LVGAPIPAPAERAKACASTSASSFCAPIAEISRATRKRKDGTTEWIPPPHLDYGQPRTNTFHHPENLLADGGDEDDEDGAA